MLRGATDSELDRAAALKCASLVQRVALLVLPADRKPGARATGASSRFLRGSTKITERAPREAQTSKGAFGCRGATRTEAPRRREGRVPLSEVGARRAASQWGQGAGAWLFIRADACWRHSWGLSNTQDA